jgi:hypothetical protein
MSLSAGDATFKACEASPGVTGAAMLSASARRPRFFVTHVMIRPGAPEIRTAFWETTCDSEAKSTDRLNSCGSSM